MFANIGTLMYLLYLLGASLTGPGQKNISAIIDTNDKFPPIYINEPLILNENERPSSKTFRIVIDPGHGGRDPGCKSKYLDEKELVLSVGTQLGEILQANNPGLEVYYTRITDVFVPLRKRIQFANELNADLFVSIHANQYSDKNVHGAEMYVLGLHAAKQNLEVAKRENASILLESDYTSDYEGYVPNSAEEEIIMSMFQNLYLDNSIHLGKMACDQIGIYTPIAPRGVKQAGFVVLKNASMPSILAEIGFLSNDGDAKYLSSREGQKQMALALARSIENYFKVIHPDVVALKR